MQTYRRTMHACFIGYIVQAVVNNFLPLLFLVLHETYSISFLRITFLITLNFSVQLLTDLSAILFVDRIGYRTSMLLAHGFSAAGLVGLSFLPDLLPDPYTALCICVVFYAVGGGLLEVLVSPIVEACPTPHKESAMSLLHSFYCWGHVFVVLLTVVYFTLVGSSLWRYLACIWALLPLGNLLLFLRVPIPEIPRHTRQHGKRTSLLGNGMFYLFFLMMFCSGASEQAVSQWASAFAEYGLGVDKILGDLLGPMLFAVAMGLSRTLYARIGTKIPLRPFMTASTLLCLSAYLLISLSPYPALSFAGCALCGFSVGIFWPGTFSQGAGALTGSTSLFALLALAGDLGCAGGPSFVGLVMDAFSGNLHTGILFAALFPFLLLVCLLILRIRSGQRKPA